MKNNKKKRVEKEMMDAVLILPSEDFHHFDCNLGLKIEVSDSCRLKYCFKSKNKEEKGFFFLFVCVCTA